MDCSPGLILAVGVEPIVDLDVVPLGNVFQVLLV
jgi:hypothetical protein